MLLLVAAHAKLLCSMVGPHATVASPAGLELLPLSDPMHLKMAESLGAASRASSLAGSPESLQLTHVTPTPSLAPCLPPASLALGFDGQACGAPTSVA